MWLVRSSARGTREGAGPRSGTRGGKPGHRCEAPTHERSPVPPGGPPRSRCPAPLASYPGRRERVTGLALACLLVEQGLALFSAPFRARIGRFWGSETCDFALFGAPSCARIGRFAPILCVSRWYARCYGTCCCLLVEQGLGGVPEPRFGATHGGTLVF